MGDPGVDVVTGAVVALVVLVVVVNDAACSIGSTTVVTVLVGVADGWLELGAVGSPELGCGKSRTSGAAAAASSAGTLSVGGALCGAWTTGGWATCVV